MINWKGLKRLIGWAAIFCFFIGLGAGFGGIYSLNKRLPSLEPLEDYGSLKLWEVPTKIYAANGELIGELFVKRRELVKLSQIPKNLIKAAIAVEDASFYEHQGIDLKGIIRAFFANLRAGRIKEGGSTITQQLAKLAFLSHEKTYSRKIAEILLSLKIERRYTKDEILERYFNKVYFGHGAYGVEAAANFYFNKQVEELSLAECALLAGLPKAPSYYSPISHLEEALRRQATVLRRMVKVGDITPEEEIEAKMEIRSVLEKKKEEPRTTTLNKATYFVEYVRQELEKTYDPSAIYKGGLRIYTTLDLAMQEAAQDALWKRLKDLNKDKKEGQPRVEGALIAIDPRTGQIKAMVGGSGFKLNNQFNRAIQAKRQAGSAFKPFLYAAAIDSGWTPASTFVDEPATFKIAGAKDWTPKNYYEDYQGEVTLRTALEKSINVVSAKLINRLTPTKVVRYAHQMGIKSSLAPTLSLALGTSSVSLLEMTSTYGVFANSGIRVEPLAVQSIKDREGNLLEKKNSYEQEAISKEVAYVLTAMMTGVVQRGTAYQAVGSRFNRPCAGKTGTTDDFVDAWFIGFTPQLVAGVWIGYDEGRKSLGIGMTGGVVAAPVWTDFMEVALKDEPVMEFSPPSNVSFVSICKETGLLATPNCPYPIREVFLAGSQPTTYCTKHQGALNFFNWFPFKKNPNQQIDEEIEGEDFRKEEFREDRFDKIRLFE